MILCDGNYIDWVHMAWSWCIIGKPSEAGLPSSLYYKIIYLYIFSAKAPVIQGSGSRRLYPLKGTSLDRVYVCLLHVWIVGFFLLFVKNGFVRAFAEGNSDPLKHTRRLLLLRPAKEGGRSGMEGGRDGGREEGREGGREGGWKGERGREGGREG